MMEGLTCKGTVVRLMWASETLLFGVKGIEKNHITTVA